MTQEYYMIQTDETLRTIAATIYGDPELARELAGYNGIFDPALILAGQMLEIPSKDELEAGRPRDISAESERAVPHTLDDLLETFGDIREYIQDDATVDHAWEEDFMTHADLPFPIPMSGFPSKLAQKLQCHKMMTSIFVKVFETVEQEGLKDEITRLGGCYNFRCKRGKATKLSTHSWGIAIDLNPETNAMGTKGNMHPQVIAIFRHAGFKWGGDWKGSRRDPMHFQFCTGY